MVGVGVKDYFMGHPDRQIDRELKVTKSARSARPLNPHLPVAVAVGEMFIQ